MLPNGTVLARSVIRDWRRRHLVTVITNSVNGEPQQRLGYTHDILDRVTRRNTDTFDYNARSEVISAIIRPTMPAGTLMTTSATRCGPRSIPIPAPTPPTS